jgi:hypothetical protein
MSKKEILVPFDLAKAKAGAKLKTIGGSDVRVICYDRKTDNEIKLVALVTNDMGVEISCGYTEQGHNFTDDSLDIKIVEEVEEPDRWRDTDKGGVEGWSLTDTGQIVHSFACKDSICWATIFAKKKMARAAKAAAMISQIIANDKRFGGAITDEEWKKESVKKFVICREKDELRYVTELRTFVLLAFHTAEQRALFLAENEDLVRRFYML